MADKPIVAPTPLPDSPPVPQRNDPSTFEDRFDAGWEYMFEVLRPGIDATAENVYENALAAEERAVAADERATDAENAKQAAEDARDKAQDWAEGVEPAPGSKSAKGWAEEAEIYKDGAVVAAAAAGSAAGLPSMVGQEGKALMVQPGVGGGPPVPGWGLTGVADFQEFSTSGTWVKPDGANFVAFHIVAGGGGGLEGGGGSGGQGLFFILQADQLGATESVTVGSGGLSGQDGGNSSFAGITAKGGAAAAANMMSMLYGYIDGSTTSVQLLFRSRGYFEGYGTHSSINWQAGHSVYGGGGGSGAGSGDQYLGKSFFAGDGGISSQGQFPGGGGGGANPGAAGVVRVWCW